MSRKSRGLQKEHEIAKEIYEATGGAIIPVRAGYSGNSAVPLPDLLIPVEGSLRAIELKTSSQGRFSVKPEDVEQVVDWSMDMTQIPTFPYLAVKFNNYEVYCGRLKEPWDIQSSFEVWAKETPLKANVTNSGNLSVHNPTKFTKTERDARGIVSARSSPGDGPALIDQLRDDSFANTAAGDTEVVSVYDVIKENPDWDGFEKR